MNYDVKNLKLADKGKKRIIFASQEMPVLQKISEDFQKRKPLKQIKLAAFGISIDALTEEQKKYLSSWEIGT